MISRRVNRRGGSAVEGAERAECTAVAPSAESLDPPRMRLALRVRHIPDHRSFAGGIYIFAGVGLDGAPLYRNASGCAISRQPVLAPDESERYGASGEPVWTIATTQVRPCTAASYAVFVFVHRVSSPPLRCLEAAESRRRRATDDDSCSPPSRLRGAPYFFFFVLLFVLFAASPSPPRSLISSSFTTTTKKKERAVLRSATPRVR